MFGCDLHASWVGFPGPVPPMVPVAPHYVGAMSQFFIWHEADAMRSPTVDTAAGQPLRKIFDIGRLIPHVGVNSPFIIGLLILGSSSQGHFGVSSVQMQTNDGQGPVAGASSSSPIPSSIATICPVPRSGADGYALHAQHGRRGSHARRPRRRAPVDAFSHRRCGSPRSRSGGADMVGGRVLRRRSMISLESFSRAYHSSSSGPGSRPT